MAAIDFFILKKVMTLAHWLDYRFHWNNYRIASWVYQFTAICLIGVVATVVLIIPNKDGGAATKIMLCVINPPFAFLQLHLANRLKRASDKWERDPSQIPTEAYAYILWPPLLRIIGIVFGLFFGIGIGLSDILQSHAAVWLGVISGICWAWNAYDAIARYFAGIPPSRRQRKKAKARDWSFGLTLKPIGVST